MCGILGIYNKQSQVISNEAFAEALQMMHHRGPDSSKIIHHFPIDFGHARLKILDLSQTASQPFYSSSRRSVIIFNGEIYNHQTLKQELCSKGYHFKTTSDTEVLITLYEHEGIEKTIQKIDGMFAFAIFDFSLQKLWLVRDRFGIKPLYYHSSENALSFASELRPLLMLYPETKRLNPKALSAYLSFRYSTFESSFFETIYSVPPSCYLEIDRNKMKKINYWNLAEHYNDHENMSLIESDLVEELDELLKNAIHMHKQADVNIGAFLSGGVDSSLISAYAVLDCPASFKTMTAVHGEKDFDETIYAREVANLFQNIEHHELSITRENYFSHLQHLITLKSAPLVTPNEVSLYCMSKEFKKKQVSVVLSGEGADEIFGGYGRIFRSTHDWDCFQRIKDLNWSSAEKNLFLSKFKKKYSASDRLSALEQFWSIYPYTTLSQKQQLLSQDIDLDSIEQELKEKVNIELNSSSAHYDTQIMLVFIKLHLPGLLARVDAASMAASVEARVPFLDRRLVEFAGKVPHQYKLKWLKDIRNTRTMLADEVSEVHDIPKYLLKKTGEKYLPPSILYRKKMGFALPIEKWLLADNMGWARDVLLSSAARTRGIYNIPHIEKLLSKKQPLPVNALTIWMLINFELFCQIYSN